MENLVILGSGNAGLTAAIYAGRANLNPVLVSGYQLGGQLTTTSEIENFPGFPDGINGIELMQRMQKQAEKFGTRIIMDEAKSFDVNSDGSYTIFTNSGEIVTKSVIIATGASARWLDIPSEAKFKGRGIHTCATCDGFFYKDKIAVVVGGGDSACEEANFLTKFAEKVILIHRRDELRASKIMQEKVFNNPKIDVIWNSEIKEYVGDNKLEKILIYNSKTTKTSELKVHGVFLALGHIPNTDIFKNSLDLDSHGFIVANGVITKLSGVFVAGDVSDVRYKQAITASASGCMAAMEAEKYLS